MRVERRDNTQVGIDVQPLDVDVIRFAVVVIVQLEDDGGCVVTVLNNGIVVQPEEAKVGARLCTIVNVDVVVWKGRWGFS